MTISTLVPRLFVFSLLFSFLLALGFVERVAAADRMKGPLLGSRETDQAPDYQISTVKLVWKGAIGFYSGLISPADGPRSPSYPTSTIYGKQAIERYGFWMGIVLIADRLFHEADIHLGPRIILHGTERYFDPVENNTFWWDGKESGKLADP